MEFFKFVWVIESKRICNIFWFKYEISYKPNCVFKKMRGPSDK